LASFASRPVVTEQRLSLTLNGTVRYQLKTPCRDGTTHVIFEPLDFMARLAALAPRPRVKKSGSKRGKREFYTTAKVIMRLVVRAMGVPLPMNDPWTSKAVAKTRTTTSESSAAMFPDDSGA